MRIKKPFPQSCVAKTVFGEYNGLQKNGIWDCPGSRRCFPVCFLKGDDSRAGLDELD